MCWVDYCTLSLEVELSSVPQKPRTKIDISGGSVVFAGATLSVCAVLSWAFLVLEYVLRCGCCLQFSVYFSLAEFEPTFLRLLTMETPIKMKARQARVRQAHATLESVAGDWEGDIDFGVGSWSGEGAWEGGGLDVFI